MNKKSTYSFTIILLFASVALNVCALTGCKSLHDVVYGTPCKYSETSHVTSVKSDSKSELVKIAERLHIKTAGMTSSDLLAGIWDKLDKSDRSDRVPQVYDAAAFNKMAKDLNSEEEDAMRKYQGFISELQGKHVVVFE